MSPGARDPTKPHGPSPNHQFQNLEPSGTSGRQLSRAGFTRIQAAIDTVALTEQMSGLQAAGNSVIDVAALQARFAPAPSTMPDIVVSLPPIASYDVLLSGAAAA